jgi:dihydrofolate reductase
VGRRLAAHRAERRHLRALRAAAPRLRPQPARKIWAREAAGEKDVAIAGGAATVNQYLAAGLIDELRLHVAPVVLGQGERLFEGVGRLELRPVEARHTDLVTHVRYVAGGANQTIRPS